MNDFEKRLKLVEDRNRRVEADKAWETSYLRRGLITVITYVFIGIYLNWLDVNKPWLNAAVPAVAFLLSTLVIQKIKNMWLIKRK